MHKQLVIKFNPNHDRPGHTDGPAKYHVHLRDHTTNTDTRFQLNGFSYFGEVGGLRHIPNEPPKEDPDGPPQYVVLYPEGNSRERVTGVEDTPEGPGIRRTYAQYLAHLADKKVTMVRTWAFEPFNEADSYPFFHQFGSDQYDLNRISTRYLRRLVRFIDIARGHGIVVHLTIASSQMLRGEYWINIPFSPRHSIVDAYPGIPANVFCSIGEGGTRYVIQQQLIQRLVAAVKPYWNVMFELMNEAGNLPVPAKMVEWHKTVATWLNTELADGRGGRSHLVTSSPVYTIDDQGDLIADHRTAIMKACVDDATGKSLIDVVSFHGNGWGGNDDVQSTPAVIRTSTIEAVKTLYRQFPNHQVAIICDSDAMVAAQKRPDLYGVVVLKDLNLDYGHRWQESALSPAAFEDQLTKMATAGASVIQHRDPAPTPGPIPVVSPEESQVAGAWRARPGIQAIDIGVFRHDDDSVWALGHPKVDANNYTIYRLVNGAWRSVAGGAVRISVGPAGPWVTNSLGHIYRWTNPGWRRMPGTAHDIGVGADDLPWVIGTNAIPSGGFGIYRWNGQGWLGATAPVGGVRIAVNPVNEPWITTGSRQIWRRDGSGNWVQVPGGANDVGVGLDDTAWVIGTNASPGLGFGIYYWLGHAFRALDGAGTAIAVDHDGLPWVVNEAGAVYQRVVADTELPPLSE